MIGGLDPREARDYCLDTAKRYEAMGDKEMAEHWRRLARKIEERHPEAFEAAP